MYNLKSTRGWRTTLYIGSPFKRKKSNNLYPVDPFSYTNSTTIAAAAGILTAGQLNDFSKWELWKDISENELSKYQRLWKLDPSERFSVQVISEVNRSVINAKVFLKNKKGKIIWSSRTDNTGKAELWANFFKGDNEKGFTLDVSYNGKEYSCGKVSMFPPIINILKIPAECKTSNQVDIAFMVDATGSMGDEIDFLKEELKDIITSTKADYPELLFRLGTVFYRCAGNSYTSKKSDFTGNIDETISYINMQSAGEGGEESVEIALEMAVNDLVWDDNARTRILFMFLDEPPTLLDTVVEKIKKNLKIAAEKGIRIIPVVGSGAGYQKDKRLEYMLRSAALATNGTYVFLTDNSNVGDTHTKPTTDEYDVMILNDLLKQLIYQYIYMPSCDQLSDLTDINDTMYVNNIQVIAHEVIDTSRNIKEIQTQLLIKDFTGKDSLIFIMKDTSVTDSDDIQQDSIILASVQNIKPAGFKYFPNPSAGELNIEINGDVEELFLTDITGKLLEKYSLGILRTLTIYLNNYPTGIYFLKMQINGKTYSGKIILVR
ncbi:MAG: T9SS type A sorting domain-containing protein [Bacteroidota bacterium]